MIGWIILGVIVFVVVLLVVLYVSMRSKGNISLNLSKFDFAQGETIKGTIKLNLKKPVEARALSVKITGVTTTSSNNVANLALGMSGKGGNQRQSSSSRYYDVLVKQIDGPKVYPIGENSYDFELEIPSNIKQMSGNQAIDGVIKTMQFVAGQRVDWYLTAYLDMKGFDIKKSVRIYIN
jgi:hypothetical protein